MTNTLVLHTGELLLATLTAFGETCSPKYKRTFHSVFSSPNQEIPRNAHFPYRDALSSLGHCEIDLEANAITVCPPVLARLPGADPRRATLVGARTSALLQDVRELPEEFEISISNQEQFVTMTDGTVKLRLPDAIILEASRWDTLRKCAERLRIDHALDQPPAWQIACAAESLDDYRKTLEWRVPPALAPEETKWYDRNTLWEKLCFTDEAPQTALLWKQDIHTRQNQYWGRQEGMAAEVSREWGRWLALTSPSRNILRYDVGARVLVVPALAPLPIMFARALTLSSGLAPKFVRLTADRLPPNTGHLRYVGIEKSIADIVSSKLGMQYVPYQDNFPD